MYQLATTAGLNTTAHTIEAAAATLAQHLQDTAPAGAVHWKITTPLGTTHAGHVNHPTPAFLADTIAEITRNLADESNQAPAKPLRPQADEFTVGDASVSASPSTWTSSSTTGPPSTVSTEKKYPPTPSCS